MSHSAYLTLGWDSPSDSLPPDSISSSETNSPQELTFANCELLFQRRPQGYEPLRAFRSQLSKLTETSVKCHFNAFAYGFLTGAKNLDLSLPEDRLNPFRDEEKAFRNQLLALEKFEQLGEPLPDGLSQTFYLEIRGLLARATARDECWIAAELLLSGPATAAELHTVLGSSEGLVTNILLKFHELGITEHREDERTVIRREALPYVYFLVRELNGIDPLEILAR